MMRAITAGVVAFGLAAVLAGTGAHRFLPDPQAAAASRPRMDGRWSGEARIAVNWTAQRTLKVHLTIAPDGRVTGTVGDASLRNGRLERNRTAIGRALHVKTDWIIRGDLDGAVIKAEGVQRESVTLPLDWIDDHFEGAVHTSGRHLGGKSSMWLAAFDLRLVRN